MDYQVPSATRNPNSAALRILFTTGIGGRQQRYGDAFAFLLSDAVVDSVARCAAIIGYECGKRASTGIASNG